MRLDLNLTTDVAEGVKLSDRLIKADPSNKGEYDALKDIFEAAGSGSLFEEAPIKSLPVTIPIKEKSEYKDLSSLTWGSRDIGTDRVSTTTQVVVPCSIDGSSDMPVLLDSGSDTMLVSPEWVKKLGLKPVATAEYVGLGVRGPQKSNWVLLKKVEIGPVTIKNVPAMVISENEDFFKRVGGILPLSILRHHALLYDRRHSKLVLYPSGTSPASVLGKGTYVVKSLWPYDKPFVQVSINGHRGLYCMVDTGAYTTHLSLNKMEALDIKPNSGRYSSATGSGLSGILFRADRQQRGDDPGQDPLQHAHGPARKPGRGVRDRLLRPVGPPRRPGHPQHVLRLRSQRHRLHAVRQVRAGIRADKRKRAGKSPPFLRRLRRHG